MSADPQLAMALKLRDEGIAAVAGNNQVFIATMIGVARLSCRQGETVTADDLREWAKQRGLEPTHSNCWGALCASPEWKQSFEFSGYTKSRQLTGHGNLLRVWRKK